MKASLKDCKIILRELPGNEYELGDDTHKIELENYAIIPMEIYDKLVRSIVVKKGGKK